MITSTLELPTGVLGAVGENTPEVSTVCDPRLSNVPGQLDGAGAAPGAGAGRELNVPPTHKKAAAVAVAGGVVPRGPLVPFTAWFALTIVPDGMVTVKANTRFRGFNRSAPATGTDVISKPGVANPKVTPDVGGTSRDPAVAASYRKFEMTLPSGWVQLAPPSASHASTEPGQA